MSATNKFSLIVKNLGPLTELTSDPFSPSAMDITIFALNGSGKTFISRAFQLFQEKQLGTSPTSADDLISFGQTDMKFQFSFNSSESAGTKNEFRITAKRGQPLSLDIKSNWKVHVFNHEFIEKHIRQDTYTCSDKITGDILIGEENIQIHELEKELKDVIQQKDLTETSLRDFVMSEKGNLEKIAKVAIKEFRDLSYESISQHPVEKHKYEEVLTDWNNIKEYNPDEQTPLNNLSLPSAAVINDIMALLKQEITISTLDKNLRDHLTQHFEFFKQGTELLSKDENTCPFCYRTFDKGTSSLVDKYKQFFADEEAKLVSDIESAKISLGNLEQAIKGLQSVYQTQAAEYEKQKIPFPELKDHSCPNLQACFKRISETLTSFRPLLQKKLEDKTVTDFGQAAILSAWNDDWDGIKKDIPQANLLYSYLDGEKNRIKTRNLNTRKQLVQELGKRIYVLQKEKFESIVIYDKQIKALKDTISTLKAKVKKSKRQAVEETFRQVLYSFFKDYYTYDSNKGRLKHHAGPEINKAPHTISEGEKSTLAFCHYMALTHSLIENKDDYNHLFFVIDDPISSMDHQYCYQTAQIIRTLKDYFPNISGHARFLILTHNVEFANILFCNKISEHRLRLKKGRLSKLTATPILPYEGHLQHIYNISINKDEPTFYTPNCIRHILETLWNFKYPRKKFKNFLETESFFTDKMSQIGYTLIHDLSHGRLRADMPIPEEKVIDACKLIIEYIRHECPGQIDAYCI